MIPPWHGMSKATHILLALLVLLITLLLTGCAKENAPDPNPGVSGLPTSAPAISSQHSATKTGPVPSSGSSEATNLTSALSGVRLEVWSPVDGAEVTNGTVRIMGKTQPDAAIAINGVPADVDGDGVFRRDISLEDGANLIEVVSADLLGDSAYQSLVVFSMLATDEPPLSVYFPSDGLQVRRSKLTLTGGSSPDAIVAVNGRLVSLNSKGIFATDVALEKGSNLIEVISTDIEQHLSHQSMVVFYVD